MNPDFFIHDIDPVLFHVWGPIAIRWYGLSYVVGFVAAFLILNHWAKRGWYRVQGEELRTLIVCVAIGVMLGARVGFIILYNFQQWMADPLLILQVWRGGMSSHGGMLGLVLAVYLYSRSRRVPFLHLMDGLACVGPVGIFFGRLANFINGELWGRVTSVRWAVIFPQEAGLSPPQPSLREEAIRLFEAGYLHPRHPSQLYAAVVEGLLVLGVMLALRRTEWAKTDGRLCVAFLLAYAAGRTFVEFFREPEIVHFGWLTQGQLLSLLMIIPAVLVWRFTMRRRR